jgi:uncharacterized protein GlcG (DUF336 family)
MEHSEPTKIFLDAQLLLRYQMSDMCNRLDRSNKCILIMSVLLSVTSAALAQQTQQGPYTLPGDTGKPPSGYHTGIPNYEPPKPAPAAAPATVRAPGIELALKAARAIADGCKQYPLAVAVVNAKGVPILTYVPDGHRANQTYTAIRKAYTAILYDSRTEVLGPKALQDAEFGAKVIADPNQVLFGGGIPLKVGNEIIGAIGVGGAEPGHHDDECGMKGYEAIKDELK